MNISDISKMDEVEDVTITWQSDGTADSDNDSGGSGVQVAGQFSNWEPLNMTQQGDGSWTLG